MSRLRERLYGAPTTAIALLALVLALGGAAYAAKRAAKPLTKAQIIALIKANAGAGPEGKQGPSGTNGKDGANGENGKAGEPGKGVVLGAAGAHCTTPNGTSVEVAGEPATKKYVCNGTTGYAATLPSGKTLRGLWGHTDITNTSGEDRITTSFPVAVENAAGEGPTPELIAVGVTAGTGTGNLTSGSTEVTNVTTASGELTVGSTVSDTTAPAGIPPGTTITKVEEAGGGPVHPGGHVEQFALSAPATATATGDSLSTGLPSGCTGNYKHPGAEPGFLCVFAGGEGDVARGFGPSFEPSIVSPDQTPLDGTLGFSIYVLAEEEGHFEMFGSYAATAE